MQSNEWECTVHEHPVDWPVYVQVDLLQGFLIGQLLYKGVFAIEVLA